MRKEAVGSCQCKLFELLSDLQERGAALWELIAAVLLTSFAAVCKIRARAAGFFSRFYWRWCNAIVVQRRTRMHSTKVEETKKQQEVSFHSMHKHIRTIHTYTHTKSWFQSNRQPQTLREADWGIKKNCENKGEVQIAKLITDWEVTWGKQAEEMRGKHSGPDDRKEDEKHEKLIRWCHKGDTVNKERTRRGDLQNKGEFRQKTHRDRQLVHVTKLLNMIDFVMSPLTPTSIKQLKIIS